MTHEEIATLESKAEEGNTEALIKLGHLYCHVLKGAEKDDKRGVEYYKKAAEKENEKAFLALGWCYMLGIGVKLSPAESFSCFKKAADLGCVSAYLPVANCYSKGLGTPVDKHKERQYLELAADQGDIEAKKSLQTWGVKPSKTSNNGCITLVLALIVPIGILYGIMQFF